MKESPTLTHVPGATSAGQINPQCHLASSSIRPYTVHSPLSLHPGPGATFCPVIFPGDFKSNYILKGQSSRRFEGRAGMCLVAEGREPCLLENTTCREVMPSTALT